MVVKGDSAPVCVATRLLLTHSTSCLLSGNSAAELPRRGSTPAQLKTQAVPQPAGTISADTLRKKRIRINCFGLPGRQSSILNARLKLV